MQTSLLKSKKIPIRPVMIAAPQSSFAVEHIQKKIAVITSITIPITLCSKSFRRRWFRVMDFFAGCPAYIEPIFAIIGTPSL